VEGDHETQASKELKEYDKEPKQENLNETIIVSPGSADGLDEQDSTGRGREEEQNTKNTDLRHAAGKARMIDNARIAHERPVEGHGGKR
jgi:hypothetical protein